ncbi:hypothetical protein Pryu01_02853 [Paraliobacillus ryukyuensis]|uniref:2',3'-cyclic-nucleotide 2'-phosphodiesterase (5'-nucleotidase family) n=2 Tax=Paraliobacillus ryukyuensis TaxID=200904 RepID=A0A366E8J3_9BACI|nr:2',3'-cyclic-nucleotide 2'-phosphodiesterase (5'-nucleotidase family) [Paraliobacillus ryukyuensis]
MSTGHTQMGTFARMARTFFIPQRHHLKFTAFSKVKIVQRTVKKSIYKHHSFFLKPKRVKIYIGKTAKLKIVSLNKGVFSMQEKIFLYYTSDIHSHFENWPKIASFFNDKKIQHNRENQDFFLFDNGDHIDRVHPNSEALLGKGNVTLLNEAGYDMVTLGNNEGITLNHNELYHLYDDADFSVICANLHSKDGDDPDWLQATTYTSTNSGITIGVIGLTAPFQAFYNPLEWNVEDPFAILDREVERLNKQADIIVLLSHLGITEDQQIAERYPMIDVIIGGHTHHLFRDGEVVNQSILTAAGKFGYYVGEVVLTWDHSLHQLVKKEAYATPIDHVLPHEETTRIIKEQTERSATLLKQTIATLEKPLEVDWFKRTIIMKQLTETLREWTNADIAMLNAGILLESLPQGTVTYADVHRICPHPINPCVVTLTGQELVEVIRGSLTNNFTELEMKGFGFRGKVIGRMVFAGVELETTINQDGSEHMKEVTFQGEALDVDQTYRLATADMFTFGQLSPPIARSNTKEFFMPEFMRDLLIRTLVSHYKK